MILRRLTEHVKAQNWFAVLLDFVIVVLGVFLGLQVNNWNADRGDRAREASYLARLAEDLRADIAEIDEIDRVAAVRMAALGRLAWAPPDAPPARGFASARGPIDIRPAPLFSEEDHGSAGIALFILTTLEGNRSAYDALISSGDFALIRDAALLGEIQGYYAAADIVRDFEISLKESRVTLVEAQRLAGISPADATPVADLAARFGEDAPLRAAARNYWLYTNRHLKLVADLRDRAAALDTRLKETAP